MTRMIAKIEQEKGKKIVLRILCSREIYKIIAYGQDKSPAELYYIFPIES
jgi:hypothetical protein